MFKSSLATSVTTASTLPRRELLKFSAAAATASVFIGRSAHAEAEIELKVVSAAPSGTPWAQHLSKFKKQIKEGTNGRVKLKAFLGGVKGGEIETVEATKRGSLDIFGGSAAALASAAPELDALELPYLFDSEAKADKVIDDAIFGDLDAILWKRGFKLLFFSENGLRSLGTNFGPVTDLAQLKGRKMRSAESQVHLNTWRAMGASPVPMGVPEVLTSLNTGVLDGFDNTPLYTFAATWYQGIKDWTVTEHIYQPGVVVASRKTYEALPPDVQKLMVADPRGEAVYGRKGIRAMKKLLVDNFTNAGIKVTTHTAAQRAAFQKATAKVHKQFEDGASADGKALIKKIRAAL